MLSRTSDERVVQSFVQEFGGDGEVTLSEGLLNLLKFVVDHRILGLNVLGELEVSLGVLMSTQDQGLIREVDKLLK